MVGSPANLNCCQGRARAGAAARLRVLSHASIGHYFFYFRLNERLPKIPPLAARVPTTPPTPNQTSRQKSVCGRNQ